MKRPVFLFALTSAFLVTFFLYSQTPTNDDPADAIALTVGSGSCSGNTAGTTVGASNSGVGGDAELWRR